MKLNLEQSSVVEIDYDLHEEKLNVYTKQLDCLVYKEISQENCVEHFFPEEYRDYIKAHCNLDNATFDDYLNTFVESRYSLITTEMWNELALSIKEWDGTNK